MAKDLPYFKFISSEWNDGDITLEDFETQGLFINICSYYWSNECVIELLKLKKKFKGFDNVIQTLIDSNIIKVSGTFISISFLDKQLTEREETSKVKSKGGKASAEARRLAKLQQVLGKDLTENEHVLNSCSTESQVLIEDKIKEEEIIKDNNKNDEFFKILSTSESWIESTAMQSTQKLNPKQVKDFLKKYNDMINVQFEIKINKNEYCKHFINWLNKQPKPTNGTVHAPLKF